MDIKQAIAQYLAPELQTTAARFVIPVEFIQTMPGLITLVLQSQSMEKDEDKQSWFNLLPLMSQEQITKLQEILDREKAKLQEIESKYDQKKLDIQKKYLAKRQEMGYVKKMGEIQAAGEAQQAKEAAEADSLLSGL